MDYKKELERLKNNNNLEAMPANPWQIKVALGVDGDRSLKRLLDILQLISENSGDDWLSDDGWREAIPEWLKDEIPELTKEQTDQLLSETPQDQWDSLPWEFLSWLDAMRERGWLWWGYKIDGAEATVVVHIGMFPERIDAFKGLLVASGMEILGESYAELSSA